MSAVILDMTTYRRVDRTVAERIRERLPLFARALVAYSTAYAEAWQRRTGCDDATAVSVGVRYAKTRAGQPEDVA